MLALLTTLNTWLMVAKAIVLKTSGNLFGKHFKQNTYGLPHLILKVNRIGFFLIKITGKQDFSEPMDAFNDRFTGWNNLRIHLFKTFTAMTCLHNIFNYFWKFFPKMLMRSIASFTYLLYQFIINGWLHNFTSRKKLKGNTSSFFGQ